jgi:gliding motility-associated-like protein
MNSYFGAMLHVLYDFSDPTILPSLFDNNATGICKFTLSISASRNGTPVSFYMITADAEASWTGETTTVHTNGSPWQTMTLFRNSAQTTDPLAGCGTQTAAITETFDGQAQHGQNPIITTLSPTTGPLVVDITLDHATTFGGMAVAFGILQSEDRGDLPASYGYAQHQLLYNITNPCGYLPPTMPSLDQDTRLRIGNVPPDADPIQYTDDNAIGVDEEGVASFPAYDGSGTYSLPIVVGNTTGHDAWLSCWFDFNRDGVFSASESSLVPVPNNASSVVATWTHLPQYLPQGTASAYGFRFRLSSNMVAVQSATGFAPDGEVEDYLIPAPSLCMPLTASILPVTDICSGQPASLHASGGISYSWSPATGLSDPSSADPIATPVSTTGYVVTASNPQGCSANASITVTVKPSPTVSVSSNVGICPGDATQLSGTSSTGLYSWTPVGGLSDPSIANPMANPSATTTYTLSTNSANGCTGSGSVTVTVNPRATVLLRTDTTICSSSTVLLSAQTSHADFFQWQPTTGLSNPSTQSPAASPAATTIYTLTASNSFNCPASASVTIGVIPSPNVSASDDILICQGKRASLQSTGALTYTWTSSNPLFHASGSTISVGPFTTTKYYVQGTAANGCTAIDSVQVNVHLLPVFAVTPQNGTICLNDSILLTASGGDSFTWTTPDGSSLPSSSSVLVSPTGSSSYQVLITDNICQLSATLNIPIIVKDLPQLSVTSTNNIDCTLGQATLHATGARSWLWAGNGSISDSTIADPIVSPTTTTTWYVKGTGANGCSSLDSITVAVDFTTDLSQYPVPSAFSPNNDGNNDCFRLKYWGRINSLELAVFNRQGARIFFTTDPQQCWDGTFKGTPQPAGAYVYQIKATTACGLAYRKGIVILVR